MPLWPSRHLSSSGTPTPSPNTSIPGTPAAVFQGERSASRSNSQDVRMLSPMSSSLASTPQYQRGHSRSISHPSPSPLSGRRAKRGGRTLARPGLLELENDAEDGHSSVECPVSSQEEALSSSPRKGSSRPEDFLIGKCMTCSATVRWPRNLKIFRCTACLTVNDLEPFKELPDLPPVDHSGKHGHLSVSVVPRKGAPVSVERTKAIIEDCIKNYLQTLLEPSVSSMPSSEQSSSNAAKDQPQSNAENVLVLSSLNDVRKTRPSSPLRGADSQSQQASMTTPSRNAISKRGDSPYLSPLPLRARRKSVENSAQFSLSVNRPLSGALSPQEVDPSFLDSESKDQPQLAAIFKPLEDCIISAFRGCDSLNRSFSTSGFTVRTASDGNPPKPALNPASSAVAPLETSVFEPDAKTLLLGDLAENSSWWMTDTMGASDRHAQLKGKPAHGHRAVTSRSPRINWAEVTRWYHLVLNAGQSWAEIWATMEPPEISVKFQRWESINTANVEKDFVEARLRLRKTLMKATEVLLKRPRRPLKTPEDTRFLLILLANPLLYPASSISSHYLAAPSTTEIRAPLHSREASRLSPHKPRSPSRRELVAPSGSSGGGGPAQHSGIIKRILGLLSNLPNDCHHYLVSWFARLSRAQFERIVDLIGGFVTYRLTRQHGRKRSVSSNHDNDLIPSLSSANGSSPAELHAAINGRSPKKTAKDKTEQPVVYSEDWQIRAAARIMALFFTANNVNLSRKSDGCADNQRLSMRALGMQKALPLRRDHLVPTSSFYNTLLDYSDLVADFEAWESKSSKFSFCQYPFFLSIWAKIHILEHDARRQMEIKAREAFFSSILNRKAVSQYLVLKVRRDCLVEDSLRNVSEVVGSGQEEIKKGLRIEFVGEEGIDAGGLRKEWFLLLVREIFDPHHGLFVYDEESQYCYFNPYCFESSEQFFLVGVLLGLAIYNSTILDVALPPFAFKKLLAAAPHNNGLQPSTGRPVFKCTLDDLAEYRPALAKGLQALLDYEGDVSETFCHDFVAQVDRYGERMEVPLCPGGERRPVTNSNRGEFVDLYVHYLLDTAVARQFEPFKRGFFTVCGGNALSLFRPEEIELLVRGSDEALDVASLRAVATYDNWPSTSDAGPDGEPVVQWFWEFLGNASPSAQRQVLSFITGSDRIPAMGASSLMIRLAFLGDDAGRYPTARTCFNTLGLYRYRSREELADKLWGAVVNSEGFGLK